MSPVSVPGLGARFQWSGGVTLGDPTVWPRYRLFDIQGLASLGEREDHRDPRYARTGEIPRRSPRRGKTVTFTGRVQARTFPELRQGRGALLAAFDQTPEGRMDILTPQDPSTPSMYFVAGAMACDVPEVHVIDGRAMEWERDFVIALRLSDPYVYQSAWAVSPVVGRFAPEGATLPQTLPFTIPVGATVIGSPLVGGVPPQVTVLNGGAPSDPVIDVPGPFTGLTLFNDSIGAQLNIPTLGISAGSVARVDFRDRSVMVGATDSTGLVDFPSSTWWDADHWGLAPNVNLLRARSSGADVPFTVRYQPAYQG